MDDVRERLVGLIASKICFKYSKDCILREKNGGCGSCFCGFFRLGALVDHLIENGVTVEEIATAAEQPRNDMDGQRGDSCWIWTELGEADCEQYWVCSECGERSYYETNYCPCCGVKMAGAPVGDLLG